MNVELTLLLNVFDMIGPRKLSHNPWVSFKRKLIHESGVTIKPNRCLADLGEFRHLCGDFGP